MRSDPAGRADRSHEERGRTTMTQVPDQVPDLPAPAGASVPAALAAAPPLIAAEQQSAYDELLARVTETLKPADVLEHVFIRDIVDLVWEVLRLRRLKANLMATAAPAGSSRSKPRWRRRASARITSPPRASAPVSSTSSASSA